MYSIKQISNSIGLGLILYFSLCTIVNAATLSSTVNRNQLSMNETVALTISYDRQVDTSLLDLAPLNKDFDVLGMQPQSSSSVSIVNGQATRVATTTWKLVLAPKRLGELRIPAFTVENNASQPINIKVTEASAANIADQPLQVLVSANSKSIVPNQQLIVEIEISARADVSDLNGPQLIVDGAEVEALDQESFQRLDNGIARQVIVLRYALFAEQAGNLTIPVMTYTAIQGGRRSVFGSRGQQVVARSLQLPIKVREQPNGNSVWFPAEDVSISADWSADTTALKVGEPITRTITITAKGQRANAIPPLESSSSASGYKAYKDQPQLDNTSTKTGIVATRIESEAIVPSQGGTLKLAAQSLKWWDVKAKQWREATLPEQILTVSGSAASNIGNSPLASEAGTIENSDIAVVGQSNTQNYLWQIISLVLGLVCLLQGLYIVNARNKNHLTVPTGNTQNELSESQSWKKLQKAINNGDAGKARVALVTWAKTVPNTGKAISLQSLAQLSDEPLVKKAIDGLDQHLYRDSNDFDKNALIDACKILRKQLQLSKSKANTNQQVLASLYTES